MDISRRGERFGILLMPDTVYAAYTANRVRCFQSHGDMGRLVTFVK